MATDPIVLKAYVLAAHRAYQRGEITLDALYENVDSYLDACEVKAKERWPGRKYRRPSRAYILRAIC